MTPREFWRYLKGVRRADRNREAAAAATAWLGAAWSRADKLPSLSTVMARFDDAKATNVAKARAMTPAESRSKMRSAFAAFGVKSQGEA